VVLIRTF